MEPSEQIKELFGPLDAGGLRLRCRFVAAGMTLEPPKTWPSRRALSFYRSLVAGGAGAVITGSFQVDRLSRDPSYMEDFVRFIRLLSQDMREFGCPLVVQLGHPGPGVYNPPNLMGPIGPMPWEVDPSALAESFGACAAAAMRSGASGVEIRCCHGSLLDSFLSPMYSQGSPGDHAKEAIKMARSVLEACLLHGPVWAKVGVDQEMPGGYGVYLGTRLAVEMARMGASLVEVTSGTFGSKPPLGTLRIGLSSGAHEAPLADQCREVSGQIRDMGLQCSVMLTGGIRSLSRSSELVDQGICSTLGLGRPFIAETDLVNRWQEDDMRPSSCFSCNACTRAMEFVSCPVMVDKEENFWSLSSPD